MRRTATLLLLLLSLPLTAQEFVQSERLRARFPDVAVPMQAPFLAGDGATLTSQEGMEAFVRALVDRTPRARAVEIGRSQEGRAIPVIILSAEGHDSLAALGAGAKPVAWLVGLQHGNEPSGGEGVLAIAAALADGPLAPLLERISVVVVPRANPDGTAAYRRTAANGADPNRDHLLLTLPESRALHAAMRAAPPELVLDHHEYQAGGGWIRNFGGTHSADAMIQRATHPSVAAGLTELADGLFLPAIERALEQAGLSHAVYHTPNANPGRQEVALGGNSPGIARNAFGLSGAVSILVEARGIDIRVQNLQRRIATQFVVARGALTALADNPTGIRAQVNGARLSAAQAAAPLVIASRLPAVPFTLPLLDPDTGEPRPVPVSLLDSRRAEPSATRARPAAYLVTTGVTDVAERLRLNGVASCQVVAATEVDAEGYTITARARVNREAINPDAGMTVSVAPRRVAVPQGALVVPMFQAAFGIAAAALEPDSPGSLAGTGILQIAEDVTEVPIFRLPAGQGMQGLRLTPAPGTSEAVCTG